MNLSIEMFHTDLYLSYLLRLLILKVPNKQERAVTAAPNDRNCVTVLADGVTKYTSRNAESVSITAIQLNKGLLLFYLNKNNKVHLQKYFINAI